MEEPPEPLGATILWLFPLHPAPVTGIPGAATPELELESGFSTVWQDSGWSRFWSRSRSPAKQDLRVVTSWAAGFQLFPLLPLRRRRPPRLQRLQHALGRAVATVAGAVAAVTVCFGANDAALPDRASAVQHVPVGEYRDNLHAICAMLQRRWPGVVVILVTPPPVGADGRRRYPYAHDYSGLPERTNAAARVYARACVEVARQCGVRAIDIWSRMQKFPGWEKSFLRDGLHLTPRGNRVLFEEVVFALKDSNLSLEALPADLPLFGDMDPDNPAKSFEDQDESAESAGEEMANCSFETGN